MDITELNSKAENFKKEFEEDFKESREDYKEFLSLYPYKEHREKIDSITPETIYNPGKKPYFLYYIEFKLKNFGAIKVGTAQYAENARNQPEKFKELLKITVNDSISISDKVDAPWDDIKFFGGDRHIAKKIVFCYNPSEILPIYKTEHLEYFASKIDANYNSNPNKFNTPYEELSVGQKFEYLNEIILKFKEEEIKTEMDNVCFMQLLYQFLDPENSKDNKKEKKENSFDYYMNTDFYELDAGRGHIVRDICYLISENENITEEELFNLLRESVKDDSYWNAYYQRSKKKNSPKYNLNAARTLNLVDSNRLELTELGEKFVSNISPDEVFTYNYSLKIRKFYYEMALDDPMASVAMEILKKEKRLRFWSPTCSLTNKVVGNYREEKGKYVCNEEEHEQCKSCNRELLDHIKESSLPLETYKKIGTNRGDVFWMCSRITPMYLTGAEPGYSGNYIYWDEKAEKEVNPQNHPKVCLYPETIETNILTKKKIFNQLCGTLNSGKHVMLTGAPGTGKTNLAEDICKVAENLNFTEGSILTTATSDWTTFDTIGGYLPDENGRLVFEEGTFLKSIKENKWIIIDEINRADIDKAFGQLFTVLSGQGVTLPYKCNGKSVEIKRTNENRSYYDPETSTYYVGNNWRILATMNVYDKDYLFEMSYAFMRRFTFIYIDLPDDEDFKYLINSWGNGSTEDYLPKIHELLKINPYRQIGPAIFKDLVEYVTERDKIGTTDHILEDAVLSYILPQFEGLEKTQILDIWKILKDTFEDPEEIRVRLEEISTVKLDES